MTPIIQQIPVYVSKFTSDDFTQQEWIEIQRPSLEAAEVANTAANNANEAAASINDVRDMLVELIAKVDKLEIPEGYQRLLAPIG